MSLRCRWGYHMTFDQAVDRNHTSHGRQWRCERCSTWIIQVHALKQPRRIRNPYGWWYWKKEDYKSWKKRRREHR